MMSTNEPAVEVGGNRAGKATRIAARQMREQRQEFIILLGPPASGKSTWGRLWVAEKPGARAFADEGDEAHAKVAYERGQSVAFATNRKLEGLSAGVRRRATKIITFDGEHNMTIEVL